MSFFAAVLTRSHSAACTGGPAYAFTFLENIKHGTNITIEVLHRVLLNRKSLQLAESCIVFLRDSTEAVIPKRLYLQLDNTAKQNKSQYMLGFLGYLVQRDVFQQIVIR